MQSMSKILSCLSSFVFFGSLSLAATITGKVKGPGWCTLRGALIQGQNTTSLVIST